MHDTMYFMCGDFSIKQHIVNVAELQLDVTYFVELLREKIIRKEILQRMEKATSNL